MRVAAAIPTWLVVGFLAGLFAISGVARADFEFTKIADTNDPEFGGGFISGAPSINDAGVLAFNGLSTDRTVQGIYSGDGTSITTIADSSGILNVFAVFPTINDSGTVAFQVTQDSPLGLDFNMAIYSGSGGALQKIADNTGPQPPGSLNICCSPDISDSGVVAFVSGVSDPLGTGPAGNGVFAGSGGDLTTITAGFLTPDVLVSINSSDLVAFIQDTQQPARRSILTGDGGSLTTVIDDTGQFVQFDDVSINDSGVIAFQGFLDEMVANDNN